MLQTGILYGLVNNENAVEVKEPLKRVWLYFSQNDVRKISVQTGDDGSFRFDLPVGKYDVTMSLGPKRQILPLAAGAQFELTENSPENAFQEWVLAPTYLKPEENPFVILLREIAQEASDSAVRAKESEENAKKEVNDAVGSGKLMREGAYGFGSSILLPTIGEINLSELKDVDRNRFVLIKSGQEEINTSPYERVMGVVFRSGVTGGRYSGFLVNEQLRPRCFIFNNYNGGSYAEIYHNLNTTLDSNGFIKAASPIIRLFDDRIETNNQFKKEPVFEKIGIGTYKISNTLGLAKEGWTYEKPRGKDGNPYFYIKVDKLEDGCIISVHDVFEALEEATITDIDGNERKINKVVKILGEARDIKPHERWIDLRFHEEPEEIEEIGDFEEEQSDLEKHLEENNAVLF